MSSPQALRKRTQPDVSSHDIIQLPAVQLSRFNTTSKLRPPLMSDSSNSLGLTSPTSYEQLPSISEPQILDPISSESSYIVTVIQDQTTASPSSPSPQPAVAAETEEIAIISCAHCPKGLRRFILYVIGVVIFIPYAYMVLRMKGGNDAWSILQLTATIMLEGIKLFPWV
ncbi:hypothetical protein RUND412_007089 [Rhizina undulata]